MRDESRRVVAQLQARYAEETGIRSLKIRHNNVLGYFVDVTAQHGDKMLAPPLNRIFIHRQTLAGQVRFTTTELGALEAKIASAADRALAIELQTFERLVAAVAAASAPIKAAADALAVIDVAAALASLAAERDYVRPEIDATRDFVIERGRHPVVEQALARASTPFVANDCDLSPPAEAQAGRIWLLTGPNMAGKSTFLRQNALIVVLAQMGSFVPAQRARIGVVDRLFSRVGAADDLARGRSTFMVEMVETAAILNQAGERSLVILDEIGRGTATFDGLSIAWATIEHLHESNRCRALFATHFHELTALAAKLPRLFNATVKVKEWQGDVVFLHEVAAGAADRSYGIQVAKLAGLPGAVIERAKVVLAQLEAEDRTSARRLIDDLPLFAATARPAAGAAAGCGARRADGGARGAQSRRDVAARGDWKRSMRSSSRRRNPDQHAAAVGKTSGLVADQRVAASLPGRVSACAGAVPVEHPRVDVVVKHGQADVARPNAVELDPRTCPLLEPSGNFHAGRLAADAAAASLPIVVLGPPQHRGRPPVDQAGPAAKVPLRGNLRRIGFAAESKRHQSNGAKCLSHQSPPVLAFLGDRS